MIVSDSRPSRSSSLGDFFAGDESLHQRRRSGLGIFATVLFLPLLLGVMGCLELPAPVGDPEKSRIDPDMSGVWLDNSSDSEGVLWIFEYYDKRTWLVRLVQLEEREYVDDDEIAPLDDADDVIPLDELVEVIPSGDSDTEQSTMQLLQAEQLQVGSVVLFKAWRKRISGRSFVTMELKGMLDSDAGMDSGIWWVAKADLVDADHLSLEFIKNDFDDIEDGMNRSQLERVVRRNIGNPEMFSDEIFGGIFERVPEADYDILAGMMDEAGVAATY